MIRYDSTSLLRNISAHLGVGSGGQQRPILPGGEPPHLTVGRLIVVTRDGWYNPMNAQPVELGQILKFSPREAERAVRDGLAEYVGEK